MQASLRNRHNRAIRPHVVTVALAFAVSALAIQMRAAAPPQSFDPGSLQSGFTQELHAVTQMPADDDGFAMILGGIAFAPDGDVWSSDCVFSRTRLHRFDRDTTLSPSHGTETLHPESAVVQTEGGCGLTNHPDGFLYSNSLQGVWKLDASTGLPAPGPNPVGPAGNALGITVDPQVDVNGVHHLVYVGADCHPSAAGPDPPTCTLYDLDPMTGTVTPFAQTLHAVLPFVDGIYFEPDGHYLFATKRGESTGQNALVVIRRPAAVSTLHPTIVQSIPMTSAPDGVSFHATAPKFVVTNDESNGTMTRFDFQDDDYTLAPSETSFASGGFRGDLTNVGPDGCIYATQGRFFLPDEHGTRYDDGTETTEDSVVKICAAGGGGFAMPPGTPVIQSTTRLTVVKHVVNDNGGSASAGAWTMNVSGGHPSLAAFPGSESGTTITLDAGDFSVAESGGPSGYLQTSAVGCVGTLAAGESATCTITNDDQPAHLTLTKVVVNDNGGTAVAAAFTLSATGPTPIAGAGGVSEDVNPGSYTLSETGLAGYSASLWSCAGATLTGTAVSLAGGQSATCTITNDDQTAHLTLTKVVVNDNGGTAVAAAFTLSATGPTPIAGAGGVSEDVNPGSYTLSETGLAGYSASLWSCSGATLTGTSVSLVAGQSATCTITNDDQPAHLTLTKVVVNNNGGTAVAADFTLSAAGPTPIAGAGGVSQGVSAGTYSLSETTKPGYAASAWACTGGMQTGSTVALTLGQSATCTITNDDQPAHLTLTKVVVNNNGGTAVAADFTLSAVGPTPIAGAGGVSQDVSAGNYALSETTKPGYAASAWACTGGMQSGSTVALTLGQSATCTITNDDQPAHLTLTKVVVNNNGGTAVAANFTLSAAGPTPIAGAGGVSQDVSAGSYALSETTKPGYTASAWSCTGGTQTGSAVALTLGQSATCTITNDDQAVAAYATYTQGGWGAPPNGNNPGMLLRNNFATVYPSGVTIGGTPYYLKWTSSVAIEGFLPAGGKPGVLNKSQTNPTSSSANVFGGQVLALRLSVDFSNAGIITGGLSSTKIAPGNPLAGSTVAQVLAIAMQVIAGNTSALPAGMTVSKLNDLVTAINQNYDNGTTNNGLLVP